MQADPVILVSPGMHALHADEIARHAPGHEVRAARLPDASGSWHLPEPAWLAGIRYAFLSTDLIGMSGVVEREPPLRAFFDTLLAAPQLQWLHVCAAGADRVQFRQLAERGVTLTTSSGANAVAVAHSAMAALLALTRNIPLWIESKRTRCWTPQRYPPLVTRDLGGQRLTVVGMGPIGRELAKIAAALGMRVTGIRQSSKPDPHCVETLPYARLREVLPHTDWLVLACPLTNLTRGLVNAEALALMPTGSGLVNVSRGGVLSDAAMEAALRSGQLAGAYADVFETEPLPANSTLWDTPNLMISAHSAGHSDGFSERTYQMFLDNLQRQLSGAPLVNLVQRSRTYKAAG